MILNITHSRRFAIGLGSLAVATRLPFLPGYLANHDAVNFALGLEHFDLLVQQPHFPGYPVFLAAAWPFRWLGLDASTALTLPAALLAGVATVVLFLCLLRRGTHLGGAAIVAACYALLPGPWLADITAMSDGFGLHWLTLCVCGAMLAPQPLTTGRTAAVGLGLGLLVGIRASWFPVIGALGLVTAWRSRRPQDPGPLPGPAIALLAFAAGVGAWLVPLVASTGGAGALWRVALEFTGGHVTQWGNTAVSGGGALTRAGQFADATLAVVGLLGILALVVLALVWRSQRGSRWRVAVLVALPYAVFVALGQNPESPRHLLPFLPLALIALAPAAAAEPPRWVWAVPVLLLGAGLVTAHRHATVLPASLQAVAWITERHGPEQLQIYTGSEARLFQHYAPMYRATRVLGARDIERDLSERGGRPDVVLVTSTAGDLSALASRLDPIARFSRDTGLTLYALRREAP